MSAKIDKLAKANQFFAYLMGADKPLPLEIKEEIKDNNLAQLVCLFNQPKLIRLFGIHARSEDSLISSLAHEWVHFLQYKTGKLSQPAPNVFYWNGEKNNSDYLNQPWEQEARNLQKELVLKFNRFCRENAQNPA